MHPKTTEAPAITNLARVVQLLCFIISSPPFATNSSTTKRWETHTDATTRTHARNWHELHVHKLKLVEERPVVSHGDGWYERVHCQNEEPTRW